MQTQEMLQNMCQQMLGSADINAICKNREFAGKNISASILETVFLSDTGVENILKSLSQKEIIVLHLLKVLGKPVNLGAFWFVYGGKETEKEKWNFWDMPDYHKGDQPILNQVKNCLVRKGILLMAEDIMCLERKKAERLRFLFPESFVPFLPTILPETIIAKESAQDQKYVFRKKLEDIVEKSQESGKNGDVYLSEGTLYIGNKTFDIKHLEEYQLAFWQERISPEKDQHAPMSPVQAVSYAFSQLKADEWASAQSLAPILKIFSYCNKASSSSVLCEKGWECGYLAKRECKGKTYYRPVPDRQDALPKDFLTPSEEGCIVDIARIPYKNLETLNRMANLQIKSSRLIASPDIVKMGRMTEQNWQDPVVAWLKETSSAFAKAFDTVDQRKGKQIVHENLIVAKIQDVYLQAQIKKAFANAVEIVDLSDGLIAFPSAWKNIVEKVVAKSGFGVKWVRNE